MRAPARRPQADIVRPRASMPHRPTASSSPRTDPESIKHSLHPLVLSRRLSFPLRKLRLSPAAPIAPRSFDPCNTSRLRRDTGREPLALVRRNELVYLLLIRPVPAPFELRRYLYPARLYRIHPPQPVHPAPTPVRSQSSRTAHPYA